MTQEELSGRLIICCDNCPVRMDLGPAQAARLRNRTPSAWVMVGLNRHYCPSCSSAIGVAALASGHRHHTPLVAA